MNIEPTSRLGEMTQKLAELKFIELASGLFILGMVLLVGGAIYFLNTKPKTRSCPKSECGSTDVITLTMDATGYQPYQCMSCGHIHRVNPLQPRDLADTAQTN